MNSVPMHVREKIFKHLNENCKEELEAINKQYPFEPLKYLDQTLELTYEEGIQMLKDAGTATTPMDDLNTDAEKKLGQLVKEKYGTDFFILYGYPLAVRPFYTMPCYDNPAYSNSFDVFIRGEEIISGAQRIHIPDLLVNRAVQCGVDVNTISAYLESFRDMKARRLGGLPDCPRMFHLVGALDRNFTT